MRRLFSYFCMGLILLVLLVLADPLDQALSQWLRAHSQATLTRMMNPSIITGKALGAGDFVIFLQTIVLGLWAFSFHAEAPAGLRRQRPVFAYILTTSILTVFWVHLTKGLIARPRPYELQEGLSSWYGLGQRLLQGWGKGSFPSGHTASAISLMAFAYASHAVLGRRVAWILGSLVVLFAVAMATSRIMVGAHWPSDTLAAVTLGWVIAHSRYRDWQKRMEKNV